MLLTVSLPLHKIVATDNIKTEGPKLLLDTLFINIYISLIYIKYWQSFTHNAWQGYFCTHSGSSISILPDQRYLLVSFMTTPERSSIAIRLGIAIRAFILSAIPQTR